MDIYYVNGRFVSEQEASISVKDLAVLRGYGVFDFLRTYQKKPFHLDDHLLRLERSARLINLALPMELERIRAVVLETLSKNDHSESGIRIVVTGGVSADGITPPGNSQLLVMVTPARPMPEHWYRQGTKVITQYMQRLVPLAKSINYIPGILCLEEARQQDAIESLYLDAHGNVLEGTTSNFFGFMDGVLVTPGVGVLAGITRKVVLDLSREVFPVSVRSIHRDEIRMLDEAFITASNKEVVPVVQIDGVTLPDGRPGPGTLRVMECFRHYTDAWPQLDLI
jgi:branched-chain amino acid aminotransferase